MSPSKLSSCIEFKNAGNAAFAIGNFAEALCSFELALDTAGSDTLESAKLHSNISATLFELHVYDQAVVAADMAITLHPEWDKGYFRKFRALLALKNYPAALQAVDCGLVCAITSVTLQNAKQTLQELPAAILQPHKHLRCSEPEQPMQSVEVVVNQLHKAGVTKSLPITVISGFLGAGKTTLLKHILANQVDCKVAVIVNDMAEVNIDAELVKGDGSNSAGKPDQLVELTNGCICCTLRDDLIQEVAELAADGRFDSLVIESTGISEPLAVAAALHSSSAVDHFNHSAAVDTMVSVVDAANFLKDTSASDEQHEPSKSQDRQPSLANLLVEQVEFANVVLLNKMDLVTEQDRGKLQAIVRQLNPGAKILKAHHCVVPVGEVVKTRSFKLEEASVAAGWQQELLGMFHPPETQQYGISSFVYQVKKPFHPKRLWQLLEDKQLPKVLRSKGFFWIASQPSLLWEWSTAGEDCTYKMYGRLTSTSSLSAGQRIVFISSHLNAESVQTLLDKCLLTDTEMSLGQSAWLKWDSPWATVQDTALPHVRMKNKRDLRRAVNQYLNNRW